MVVGEHNQPAKVFLNKTAKMRSKWEKRNSRSWRESKKSKCKNTCPTSEAELEESNRGAHRNDARLGGVIPDIFKVAVGGLS